MKFFDLDFFITFTGSCLCVYGKHDTEEVQQYQTLFSYTNNEMCESEIKLPDIVILSIQKHKHKEGKIIFGRNGLKVISGDRKHNV